ncbi:MAG: peptide chain release factor N(5)-glutamine methyltransferase [Alphaproteobacteria bacterium]|nr:peptide chain release factor N(5)-glutamine methyltransferase [Alphaproteobacteria bacterium]
MELDILYKTLRESLSEADARYVIQKRTGLSRADIISNPDKTVDESQILMDLQRHQNGEPLSRIYGEREFWGLSFALSPDTLDPRSDTETLIEAVLARYKNAPPRRILDLGTGTGCILIALLSEFPKATGVGVDLSEGALKTAHANAETNKVGNRAAFIQSNWAESIDESFDLVVSNPPYISPKAIQNLDKSVQNYDPILALHGGADGLQAYKKIFSDLFRLLNPGSRAFFEIGFDQHDSVMRLSKESRFLVEGLYPDLAGHIRVLELTPQNSDGDKVKNNLPDG